MGPDSNCPDVSVLQRFMLGQFSEPEAQRLEEHLSWCAHCNSVMDQLPAEDVLVEAMRVPSPILQELEGTAVEDLIGRLRRLRQAGLSGEGPAPGGAAHSTGRASTATPGAAVLLEPPQEPGEVGRLGSYRILQVLGSGGMGVVYQAEQTRPQRLVALKMILAGPRAGRDRLARFRAETEVVARLQHPHIVQIHEVGEHAGQPYFTMEFLEGGNLAQKLAVAPLAPRSTAELVETLARAVHFAHERGFVHRDLKPSNVLLTADGSPKVGDFGLAKQLEGEPGASTPAAGHTPPEDHTESGAILGTPSYMAPEQAVGQSKEVGPAADVYALGAILYECLTGRPPFKAATLLETLEQVRSQEPLPPGRLQPKLPRDLQTVCLKCLHKEPSQRYGTAWELADDLGRFLRGEPIHARPVSTWARLGKWVRRQPLLAALLAVSTLLVGGFIASVLVYNARLRAAVAEAQRQQQRADEGYRAARDTLERMLGRLEGRPVGEAPQKDLQRRLREDALAFYLKTLDRGDSADPTVRLDTAVACRRAADLQLTLGRLGEALANYQRTIDLLEGLPAPDGKAPETRALLAGCYQNLVALDKQASQWDEAERHQRAALAIHERLAREQPGEPEWQSLVAASEHNLGMVYQLSGRKVEALPHYTRAIALRTALVRDHPQEEAYQAGLAEDHLNLGLLCQQLNRLAEASANYEKADALLRPLVDRHPFGGERTLSLVALYVNWSQG